MARDSLTHEAYRVGWICPLEVEQVAALEMLDEEHEPLSQPSVDTNVYNLGSINNYNIVIAGLPNPGNCPAAAVVVHMTRTFRHLRYILLVGIGGGVPVETDQGAVRLGHVVVSKPTSIHSGAIQYDHGKAKVGVFERTGALSPPTTTLLNAARDMAVRRQRQDDDPLWANVQRIRTGRRTLRHFKFPGISNDQLYRYDYNHRQLDATCEEAKCDPKQRVERPKSEEEERHIVVHRGTIASGELVLKDAELRDQLAREHGVLCFEMEAAGALASFPCLVIRGVSDYCDSHKNDVWHGYAAAVAATYGRQLFFHIPPEEIQKVATPALGIFELPFNISEVHEVAHFVARKDELERVRRVLIEKDGRRIAIVQGLGGIGKTQLAIAYLRVHQEKYTAILWLNARDESSLKQSYFDAGRWIMRYHPDVTYIASALEGRDLDHTVHAFNQWLDEPMNVRWLIVYDNYDHPLVEGDMLRENSDKHGNKNADIATAFSLRRFLPQTDHGAIIVTTRSTEVNLGQLVRVGKLEAIDDCLQILAPGPDYAALRSDPAAKDLTKQLDGLPLALATAGAYLKQVCMTCSEYLELYQESWRQLHEAAPQLPAYRQTLYSTWDISLRYIEQRSSTAANMLRLWAYFDNQDLWYELLKDGQSDNTHWISALTLNKLSFHSALGLLRSHGLVEANPMAAISPKASKGYSVHACVHSWMKYVLNQGLDKDFARIAIPCVAGHIPSSGQDEFWVTQRRLLAHADRVFTVITSSGIGEQPAWTTHTLGLLYADQGKLEQAEAMYERALQGKEKAWGRDHTSTLDTVNNLGNLYKAQGKLEQAEAMYERALQGYEKAWGRDHTSTLDTVNNLGNLYADQGKLEQAEAMYERALQGYDKALGPGSITYIPALNSLENLGALCKELGRTEEAQEYYQRVLRGVRSVFGGDSRRYSLLSRQLDNMRDSLTVAHVEGGNVR